MPRAGLEPARGFPRRILSPLRLPFRHLGTRRRRRLQAGNLSKGNAGGNGAGRAKLHCDRDRQFIPPFLVAAIVRRSALNSQSVTRI